MRPTRVTERSAALGLVLLGLLLLVGTFHLGSSTLAACDFGGGLHAAVYRLFGIYPPEFSLTVHPSEFALGWYDGCNGHYVSLFPPVAGAVATTAGLGLYAREWRADHADEVPTAE